MIKIIETNTNFTNEDSIPISTQSRVIEVESWDEYVDEIKNQKQINRKSIIGHAEGVSFPKDAVIKFLKLDDRSLICEFFLWNSMKVLKTAFVVA